MFEMATEEMKADVGLPGGEEHKAFVGGISWQMGDKDLKRVFEKFGAIDARIMVDKRTGRSRGFGFVFFAEKAGLDEAIGKMHETDLEGRRISVRKAVPQDQTAPGTPASALSGDRYRAGYDRGGYDKAYRGGGYDRGYDRYAYDRSLAYDRAYDRAYERDYRGYGDPYYGRDPYGRGAYGAPDRGYAAAAYQGYERPAYPAEYDRGYGAYDRGYATADPRAYEAAGYGADRYPGYAGADRTRAYTAARPGPYDRAVAARPRPEFKPR